MAEAIDTGSHPTPALDLTRLSGSVGAELRGVDVASLDAAGFDALHAAFLANHVLVVRDQKLTPEEQIAFGERFGELLVHPIVPCLDGYPPIIAIRNFGKRHTITEYWHSDVTFERTPPKMSLLYAIDLPAVGGDTMFANQHLAYERLSPGMQAMLAGLRAVHSGRGLATSIDGDKGSKAWELQGELHPVVRTHPETGRKALFVNSGFTVGFENMTAEESAPLLRFLFNAATQPDLTMRHTWRPGDLVLWDNRSVQHYAVHDHGDAERTLHRVTVIGDEPR